MDRLARDGRWPNLLENVDPMCEKLADGKGTDSEGSNPGPGGLAAVPGEGWLNFWEITAMEFEHDTQKFDLNKDVPIRQSGRATAYHFPVTDAAAMNAKVDVEPKNMRCHDHGISDHTRKGIATLDLEINGDETAFPLATEAAAMNVEMKGEPEDHNNADEEGAEMNNESKEVSQADRDVSHFGNKGTQTTRHLLVTDAAAVNAEMSGKLKGLNRADSRKRNLVRKGGAFVGMENKEAATEEVDVMMPGERLIAGELVQQDGLLMEVHAPIRGTVDEDMHEGDLAMDEVDFMQRGRDKRKRSPSPGRRRFRPQARDNRNARDHRDEECHDEWEWDEEARRYFRRQWQPQEERSSTSSWARLPPWRRTEPASSSWQPPSPTRRPAKAPPMTPPSSSTPQDRTRMKRVSLVPTLEQLGPGVRMWSNAIGITGEREDFTGQDRHLLSNTTVFGLARDLAAMTHTQRVNAYCDLIRLLGVLYADLMRTMLRAEEMADEEVLLQVTSEAVKPSIAPRLAPNETGEQSNCTAARTGDKMDEHLDLDMTLEGYNLGEVGGSVLTEEPTEEALAADDEWVLDYEFVDETDMVEGWMDLAGPDLAASEDGDHLSYMQVAAKVGPTTAFASYLARLQAHFESMESEQVANIIAYLHDKLEAWRAEWVMALTSVSRARADRLWALLVTYQGESRCIQDSDRQWADTRWTEVVEMLQIDAVRGADAASFRLPPGQTGVISVDDTQTEQASSSADVRVKRTPGGEWEAATEKEMEELARHDREVQDEEKQQAEHDEALWTAHQAALARAWDDWVIQAEMTSPTKTRTRPLKRFKVTVSVTDSDHNELAVTSLNGEVDAVDTPQVHFVIQENIVQAPVDEEAEAESEGAVTQHHVSESRPRPDGGEEEQTETEAVISNAEAPPEEPVDAEVTDLASILDTVMGRQWFQLFVQREVDSDMVRRRWGASVLEIFQVNRDMMDLDEDKRKDQQAKDEAEGKPMHLRDFDVNVACMSDDDGASSASSGAKEFPKIAVVAGRAEGSRRIGDDQNVETEEKERVTETDGTAAKPHGEAQDETSSQQMLLDTQLEQVDETDTMDVEHCVGTAGHEETIEGGIGSGAAAAVASAGSTEMRETERASDGSFGDGRVQSNLDDWLL